jgi:hypothetical protein
LLTLYTTRLRFSQLVEVSITQGNLRDRLF